MKAVIAGDIVNSRGSEISETLIALKEALSRYGEAPKHWEVYRGDSFQFLVENPGESLLAAMRIKASMKAEKNRDVRMAIGIGETSHHAPRVTESNGDAFIRSGDRFEYLRKRRLNLALKSPWPEWDAEMNLFIKLALIAMDDWTPASAEYMILQLAHENLNQEEIGPRLGIGQSSVSERKKEGSLRRPTRARREVSAHLEGADGVMELALGLA